MTIKDKMPPFDVNTLGAVATSRPDINSRLLHGFQIQVVGTGSPTAVEYIEYVEVSVDDKKKILIVPALQRQMDNVLNANSDTLDDTFIHIPLTRPGQLWSPWGTADISRFTIGAKIVGANPGGKTLTKIQGWYAYTPVQTPQVRGDVVLQSVIAAPAGVTGWNTLANVEVKDIISLTKMLFSHDAIREIRISIGERTVFNMTRDAAAEAMRYNPMYKVPSGMAYFPVVLDDMGIASDFIPLVENGVRRPVNIEYFWDATITAVPVAFNIYIEGVEQGAKQPVATARA